MPPPRQRIAPIEHLNAEWRTLGRSPEAVRVLHQLAARDPELSRLVHGTDPDGPAPCPTPYDLIAFMGRASGRPRREQAAELVRVLLREARLDPLVGRFLLQALVPGMLTIAGRLRWGQGGGWEDGSEFFTELVSVTWEVVRDWAGQDRPFAVLDLLSAARCRIRRQLFRERDRRRLHVRLTPAAVAQRTAPSETGLEELTRTLIDLRRRGLRDEEVEVLYAQYVLGFSISELAAKTGRDRRGLYARRDRGQRRLCA
ncbi:MAG: hypothetical protein ACLPVF_17160 [Acidimicrobiales bacterium]